MTRPQTEAWRPTPQGVELAVRVTARAGSTSVSGLTTDAQERPVLQIRLNAAPVDGAANYALVAFLSQALCLRKRDVSIRAGHASRLKQVALSGDPADLARRLRQWAAAG